MYAMAAPPSPCDPPFPTIAPPGTASKAPPKERTPASAVAPAQQGGPGHGGWRTRDDFSLVRRWHHPRRQRRALLRLFAGLVSALLALGALADEDRAVLLVVGGV